MKQLLQNLRDGSVTLVDVPAPLVAPGQVFVRSTVSLVSAGTERMMVEFGQANWFQRARQQPDKVGMVLDKARTDGVAATLEAVRSKLDEPITPGYCNVGRVVEARAAGFELGDRVVSNGKHAEIVAVAKNLCVHIPDDVSDEAAAFTVLAAVGLQGIRLANPTLGECVAVIGLGLIGLLTVQMLRAQGCRVLGIDLDPVRLTLGRRFGAETVNPAAGDDVLAAAGAFSRGAGMDAVLITASTNSNEPVSQAARMCRKRGRIVLVGVTGLELSRADFYEKELSFQVSCSYGPGRYDQSYEEEGHDYPAGFVRWTAQRNFTAVLDLMASGALDVAPLISHRFPLEESPEVYELIASSEPSLGILLHYPAPPGAEEDGRIVRRVELSARVVPAARASTVFLGAGNYAGRVLMPAFKVAGAGLHTVVSAGGVSAVHSGKKHGFAVAMSDAGGAITDPETDTVVIATRHNAHAGQVLAALRAGKHVFCEKPLCLSLQELSCIQQEAASRPTQLLMVGFNRRFAPHTVRIKDLLATVVEPKSFVLTVNAGAIPPDHWTQDRAIGGGRIIGEACHFIDLLRHLAGVSIVRHSAVALGRHPSLAVRDDKASITLEFVDGSVGSIHYLANGHRSFPKERLEIFCAGRTLQLDNFRRLHGYGWNGFRKMILWRQDKGQAACARAFVDAVRRGGAAPIKAEEIFEVSRVTIESAESLN